MIGLLEKLGLYQPIDHNHKRFERLARHCESPVESAFWSAAYFGLSKFGRLTPQVKAGSYRLDFGLEAQTFKLAIESEVYRDASKCALEAVKVVRGIR